MANAKAAVMRTLLNAVAPCPVALAFTPSFVQQQERAYCGLAALNNACQLTVFSVAELNRSTSNLHTYWGIDHKAAFQHYIPGIGWYSSKVLDRALRLIDLKLPEWAEQSNPYIADPCLLHTAYIILWHDHWFVVWQFVVNIGCEW